MVRRFCNTCSKSYAHRQSLFKHKKRCGNGITKRESTAPIGKTLKDNESPTSENFSFWNEVIIPHESDQRTAMESMEGFLVLYQWFEKDELIMKMMKDLEWAKELGCADVSDSVVRKYKPEIIASLARCRKDDTNIWYNLSTRDLQNGCQWFSAENCHCDECCGGSLLDVIKYLLEIFRGMRKDDLIQNIVEDISKGGEKDAIRESLYKYKKEINDKVLNMPSFDIRQLKGCNLKWK